MNDLMGIGTANGVSEAAAASFKEQMANATLQNAIGGSNSDKVTVDSTTVTVTTGVPAGSESRPRFPASTTRPKTRSGSVVTPAPFAYRH